MACGQRPGKPKAWKVRIGAFYYASERLNARVPVENMTTLFTPHRVIAKDAAQSICAVIEQHMPARSLLLVCDDETWVAAGERIRTLIDAAGYTLTPYSFGRKVMATLAAADKLAAEAVKYDGLIAVGAGTVNDMAKYAAAQAGKPYIAVATAASKMG
jgi:glycerol-1-phosphate dehydrogenase [NAD(P)+]